MLHAARKGFWSTATESGMMRVMSNTATPSGSDNQRNGQPVESADEGRAGPRPADRLRGMAQGRGWYEPDPDEYLRSLRDEFDDRPVLA